MTKTFIPPKLGSLPYICQFSAWIKVKNDFPDSVERVRDLVNKLVEELKLTTVTDCAHQFQPSGITYVTILSESHLMAHTWPEEKAIHLDLVCSQRINKIQLTAGLAATFNPNNFEVVKIKQIF